MIGINFVILGKTSMKHNQYESGVILDCRKGGYKYIWTHGLKITSDIIKENNQSAHRMTYSSWVVRIKSLFQFPIGYPECGWEGQYCQIDVGLGVSATAGIASAVTVVFIMALVVVLGLQRYRYIICLHHRELPLRECEAIINKETNVLLISQRLWIYM